MHIFFFVVQRKSSLQLHLIIIIISVCPCGKFSTRPRPPPRPPRAFTSKRDVGSDSANAPPLSRSDLDLRLPCLRRENHDQSRVWGMKSEAVN